jgi:uracil-DNA glycosylase
MQTELQTPEYYFDSFMTYTKMSMDPKWYDLLKGYLLSEDFKKIMIHVITNLLKENKRFTPTLKNIFSAFQKTPYDSTRLVLLGQDPFSQAGIADGLAFSCKNGLIAQPSLRYMLRAINKTVYNNDGEEWKLFDRDLSRWAEQGVLLLNTALTVEVGKPNSHANLWKDFTAYVIDMLSNKKESLGWILLGKQAQEYTELFPENHKHVIFAASHPASAAYTKMKNWECNDIFNAVNAYLAANNQTQIIW